jgi:hypothetical protein
MEGIVCTNCHSWLAADAAACPGCGVPTVLDGTDKNVIDHLEPDCLIHRYEGSDMLEPAVIVKEGKVNIKAATSLREYAHPVIVPKSKVYAFDQIILGSIQALRNERTATIRRYDRQIEKQWQQLKPYRPK